METSDHKRKPWEVFLAGRASLSVLARAQMLPQQPRVFLQLVANPSSSCLKTRQCFLSLVQQHQPCSSLPLGWREKRPLRFFPGSISAFSANKNVIPSKQLFCMMEKEGWGGPCEAEGWHAEENGINRFQHPPQKRWGLHFAEPHPAGATRVNQILLPPVWSQQWGFKASSKW